MPHFADLLTDAIKTKDTPLCVGLDPRWESLPLSIRKQFPPESLDNVALAFQTFCIRVMELVAPYVAVVKPQLAFFEWCGPAGMLALHRVMEQARALGLLTILDGKRNDIASTATAYADAAFLGATVEDVAYPVWSGNAMTVNPYLGRDAIEPFLACARKANAGIFVLVRTSNLGAGLFQDLPTLAPPSLGASGPPVPLYRRVGAAVAAWARENLGQCGFGDVGAVVGATYPAELGQLRAEMPEVFFLVPGFGAQGGTAADVKAAFRADGLGAVVNSSRGILFPYKPDAADWETRIVQATKETVQQLRG